MSHKKILILILTLAVFLGCAFIWLEFIPASISKLESFHLLPFVLALFGCVSLYPLYRLAKNRPSYSLPTFLFIGGLCLMLVATIFHFSLHSDEAWIEWLYDMSKAICLVSCLLFVWKGVRQHN